VPDVPLEIAVKIANLCARRDQFAMLAVSKLWRTAAQHSIQELGFVPENNKNRYCDSWRVDPVMEQMIRAVPKFKNLRVFWLPVASTDSLVRWGTAFLSVSSAHIGLAGHSGKLEPWNPFVAASFVAGCPAAMLHPPEMCSYYNVGYPIWRRAYLPLMARIAEACFALARSGHVSQLVLIAPDLLLPGALSVAHCITGVDMAGFRWNQSSADTIRDVLKAAANLEIVTLDQRFLLRDGPRVRRAIRDSVFSGLAGRSFKMDVSAVPPDAVWSDEAMHFLSEARDENGPGLMIYVRTLNSNV
jgi:hypothetical protein